MSCSGGAIANVRFAAIRRAARRLSAAIAINLALGDVK
jgi:hypothetical protein